MGAITQQYGKSDAAAVNQHGSSSKKYCHIIKAVEHWRNNLEYYSYISLCVASVALALVFMAGLYSTAYRATFSAFYAVASSWFLLYVCFCLCFLFYRDDVLCWLLYCPFSFCLLSLLISDLRFDLVWFRLSRDHGWIRIGSVNVR